jgi:hypothetical protein
MGLEAALRLAHGQAAWPLRWRGFLAEDLILTKFSLALPALAVRAPLGRIAQ